MNDLLTPELLQETIPEQLAPTPNVFFRLWSWFVGLLLMAIFLFGLFMIATFIELATQTTTAQGFKLPDYITNGIFVFWLASLFYKDVWNGRSLGKQFLHLQVVNNTTGQPASPIQTVVRNLTFILAPVELVMIIINPTRRLGDYIANTRLERYSTINTQNKKYTFLQTIPAFFLALAIATICYIFIDTF